VLSTGPPSSRSKHITIARARKSLTVRANLPVFEALYKSVKDGSETRRSLEFNSRKTYRQDLQKELDEIDQQEIWRAGKTVRGLRVSSNIFPECRAMLMVSSPTLPRMSFKWFPNASFALKTFIAGLPHCSARMHALTIFDVYWCRELPTEL
jgi:hypothetical protein